MDIRSALTDHYLAHFFDGGTLGRGRGYLHHVDRVSVEHESGSSLVARALVHGTAPAPYLVSINVDIDPEGDWLTSSCTCPVHRFCKHAAALAMHLHTDSLAADDEGADACVPTYPDWRQRLDGLRRDVEARARASLEGLPLALEISRRPATRWSRSAAGDFTLRPMRPGARRGWVRSGAEWTDVGQPVSRGRFVPTHAAALLSLHRGLLGRTMYGTSGVTPLLGDFGDRLVPRLQAAVDAGVTLLAGDGVGTFALSEHPVTVRADLVRDEDSVELAVVATDGRRRWRGSEVVPVGRPAGTVVLVHGDDVLLADLETPLHDSLAALLTDPPVVVPAAQSDEFLAALGPLLRDVETHSPDDSVELPAPPRPTLLLSVTWRSATHALLAWQWVYGESRCDLAARDPLGGVRDPDAEAALLTTLPDGVTTTREVVGGDALALALHDLPHLRSIADVDVVEEQRPDFREATASPEIAFTLAEEQPDHTDWLDLEVTVSVDGEEVALPEVLAALTRGDEFLVLPSGVYVSLARPELDRLHEVVAAAGQLRERDGGRVSVGTHDLDVWAELAELGLVDAQAATWVERATALRNLTEVPQPHPAGLATELRPYQLEGFWWLAFLHGHGLGGILADDMGLGKTLQVLALVQHAVSRGTERPFLVVAPTSVVTAWRQQAATHAPDLRVGVVTRRTDEVAAVAAASDVVVTTYALLRLEQEQFAAPRWAGLVLDEAQQVKNHRGKTYAAARTVDADFRLAVTGTPFENRLMELWSLLSITTPGLYPWPKQFRDVVVTPVEKGGDQAALDRFRRRIRPFVLRRTKERVAGELPPKQEQVVEVDLEPRHRKIYDTHLAKERQRILGLVDDFDRNRVAIFSALTTLRQLALDPALVDPGHDRVGSAKIALLAERLVEITQEGHRALVFSQFTSFLRRVRERLTAEGVATCYLDGSTHDRQAVVDAFRSGEAPVFLISLKAGGTGLTLTEADYVFVLDPWWNPAAEAQAVDRAHRIGQDKHVHVYRLVATDTIEEKVMALKARKAELFARVIDGGGASARGISAEDVRALFEE
jgi:superfamily II DNA or RNA helicase